MSLTRLAGAWSSDGFLAKSTVPSGASRRADSALRCKVRSPWAEAGAQAGTAMRRAAEEITTRRRTRIDCKGAGGPGLAKMLSARSFELGRRLKPGRAPTRHVHGLARARVLALARLAPPDGKRAESHEGDGLSALERAADRGEKRAQGPVRGGFGPAALGRHRRDEIHASHESRNAMAIRSGRMLAEAVCRGQAPSTHTRTSGGMLDAP